MDKRILILILLGSTIPGFSFADSDIQKKEPISNGADPNKLNASTPANVILVPDYSENKEDKVDEPEEELESVTKPEKLQYEPCTQEPPILEEREQAESQIQGAAYEKGGELSIALAPSFSFKDEEIQEESQPVSE